MESSRHTAEYRPVFERWFDLVEAKCLEENITADAAYNMDEKGFMMGHQNKQRKIVPMASLTGKDKPTSRVDGNRTWATIIACVCADGTAVTPSVIFSGKNVGDNWLAELSEEEQFWVTVSEKGWTSHEIGLNWLKTVFDPATKNKPNNRIRLLIMDGHSSHISPEFIECCDTLRIRLLILPPHSTHRLQPLDVGLFAPLSTAYTTILNERYSYVEGRINVTKAVFYSTFVAAWKRSINSSNITKAFAKAGLFPHDRSVIIDKVFQPFYVPRTPSPPPATRSSQDPPSSPIREGSSRKLIKRVRSNRKSAAEVALKFNRYIIGMEAKMKLLEKENKNLKEGLNESAKKRAFRPIVPGHEQGEGWFIGPEEYREHKRIQEEQRLEEERKIEEKRARAEAAAQRKAEKERRVAQRDDGMAVAPVEVAAEILVPVRDFTEIPSEGVTPDYDPSTCTPQ